MKKKSILMHILAALAALGAAAPPFLASAQTNQWQGTDSDWSTDSNWSLGSAPADGEDVEVTDALGGEANVVYLLTGGAPAMNSLLIDGVNYRMTLTHTDVNNALQTGSMILGGAGSATYETSAYTGTIVDGNAIVGQLSGAEGAFIQGGGSTSGVSIGGDLVLGEALGATGTYELQGGTLTVAGRTIVGDAGTGVFDNFGGTHTVTGDLILGNQSTGNGTYNLDLGGTVTVSGNTIVGNEGIGLFNHVDGTHTTVDLVLGALAGSSGTYDLFADGTLTSSRTFVGGEGTGVFNHHDGSHTADFVYVGGGVPFGGTGTYTIDAGTLTVNNDLGIGTDGLGFNGGGTFIQNGGSVLVGGGFYMDGGYGTPQSTYTLNDGTLVSGFFGSMSNDSVFEHNGGTHTNNGLFIVGNSGGSDYDTIYNISGATAVANFNDLIVGGFGIGILNQSDGTVNVAGTLTIGDGPNIDPLRRYGEYNLSGGALVADNNVVIGAGNSGFAGQPGGLGTFNLTGGTVDVGGNLILGQAGSIGGGTGTFVQDSGDVTVTGGTFVGGGGDFGGTGTYTMNGGTLTTGALVVAQANATGTFNQSGGTVTVNGFLTVGEGAASSGEYNLSGGVLTAGNTIIGGALLVEPSGGVGVINQTGGTFETNFLNVGGGGFARKGTGTYQLDAGDLVINANLVIGNNVGGSGTFNQTGGTVQVNGTDPILQGVFINNGSYNLSGGSLDVASNLIVADVASGSFSQSGGSLDVGGRITVGKDAGVTGTFTMTGGTATAALMTVGDSGTGIVSISAGSLSVTTFTAGPEQSIVVGRQAGSTGSIAVSGTGSLSAPGILLVGEAGGGGVTQSGSSTVTVGGLRLGQAAGSSGTYTLDGGMLDVTGLGAVGGYTRVGLGGAGTFEHNAGTHRTTQLEISGTTFAQGSGGTGVYNLNGGDLIVTGGNNANPSGTVHIKPGGTGNGTLNVSGGTLTAALIINNDTLNYSGGSITANVDNQSGSTFNVSGGAPLTLTGTLNNGGPPANEGKTNIAANTPLKITGNLNQRTGGLIDAASSITVGGDYSNVGFGSGNSFNRHAGVTLSNGAQILGENASQTITATGNPAQLTNNGANTFTLDLGTVRGNGSQVTLNYQVKNDGTGASIRGAIQTSVNGGSVTDGRLSGTGATAGNFGPIAAGGNSGNLAVTFTGSSGGALTGQSIAIYSNFDNVATQIVNLTGQATILANGNATPSPGPVNLGNFRVGDTLPSQNFNVENTVSGSLAERLGIKEPIGTTGNFIANSNLGVGFVNPGSTQTNAITASVAGGTAGVNSGSMTIQYTTNGTLINPSFTTIDANQQTINLEAKGYVAAAGSLLTPSNNFATIQVGQTSAPFLLSIQNTATGPAGYVEDLNARFGTPGTSSFGTINTSGQIDSLAAGATNSASMSVSLTGTAAGVITALPVPVNFYTAGTVGGSAIAGLSEASVGSADFQASANIILSVVDQAKPVTNGIASPTAVNVNLGNVRVGGTLEQALSVLNQATGNDQAALNASIASNGAPVTASGSFNLLLPGATNSTDLVVGVNTGSAGAKSGTASISFVSDASNIGGCAPCQLPLASQTVNVSGNVFLQAQPDVPAVVNLGNVRLGSASQAITIGNTDVAGGFQEGLNASTGTTTGQATAGGGPIVNLAAGSTSNAISVGLNSIVAGTGNSGTVQINLASNGTVSGLANLDLASQTVAVNATGYRLADPTINNSPITIAARVGDAVAANQAVSITNSSPDMYQEGLKVTIAGAVGNAQHNSGSIANLAQGMTNAAAIQVGLASTAAAGLTAGTVTLNMISTGAGTTGAPDESLGTQNVTVNGKVYTPAVAQLVTTAVNFGIVRVGDVVGTQSVSVKNAAAATALNDTLAASMGTVSSPFNGSGSVSGLGAGQSGSGTLIVGLATGNAGDFNGTASVGFASQNPDMSDLDLGSLAVTLSGQVNNIANPVFSKTGGAGSFGCSALVCTLDFGNLFVDSGSTAGTLELTNLISGPADDLLGFFDLAGLGSFVGTGFSAVNLAFGDSLTGLMLSFDALTEGLFTGSFVFSGTSHNSFQSDLALADITVLLRANVIQQGGTVPEPGTITIVLLGAGLAFAARRRKAQQH
jgi:hypothetical protein